MRQHVRMPLILRLSLAAWLCVPLAAQGSAADYQRAEKLLQDWRGASKAFRPDIHWLPGGGVWFATGRGKQRSYVRVDADGTKRRASTTRKLGIREVVRRLDPKRSWGKSSRSRKAAKIKFENRLDRRVRLFWVDGDGRPRAYGEIEPGDTVEQSSFVGHVWLADYAKDDLVGIFEVARGSGLAVFDRDSRRKAMAESGGPSRRDSRLFVRSYDLWLRPEAGGEPKRLTSDGTKVDPYRAPRHVSPDGKRALGFRVAPGEKHLVHFVESSPKDQVQPKLHSRNYPKPGDRIDRKLPVLVDLSAGRRVPVGAKSFENAWSLDRVHWAADSSEVFLLYNRRGHQLLRLYAIDAMTGSVRSVLEEASKTFVDYSQKTWLHWLPEGSAASGKREFLWMSERDGWNHIYHVDAVTGDARQVTSGEWLVRKVERVDHEQQQIWFTAFGIHAGQDPYHAHLARIGFDGTGLTLMTEADGYHEWELSPDRSSFVTRWSRVDHPWVTELRRSSDGKRIAELGRDDVAPLLEAGYRPPERFVAKGRDGVTDIHGVLIKPSNFDASRRYPVIEDIYAGPHSHFVPKRWGFRARQRLLAELGFVVVQIDGMGTNWRSRAFHDVCWRNLKDSGFPDRIIWMREAASTRTYLDLERVGIFGGSAGGQSSLAALLHHGDFYDVAVSDCGCHDNRMDKIWWNEAWLGWPVGPWYADNSNVTHAAKLRGKLMLTVGELDRNVDPASTMQVIDALIRANKDFDFVVVPGGGHGVGETSYLVRRRQDFFVRHLLGVEPRHP